LSKTKKHPDFLKKKKGKLLIGAPNKFSTTTSCTRHEQHNVFILPKKKPQFLEAFLVQF
jgi:hypothetical protein